MWRLDQLRSEHSRALPKLLSVRHSNLSDAVEAEYRAGVEVAVASHPKLRGALAKVSRVDPECLVGGGE